MNLKPKPLELPNLRSVNLKDIELLIKIKDFYIYLLDGYHSFVLNQIISPSLRYTTYLTTVMNLFNHFNYLDDKVIIMFYQ